MAFWWVNHKQTRDHEVRGGYLWSPYRKANGNFNQTYENMRHVRAGDTVFSYAHGQIGAVGQVVESAVGAPKPTEFGSVGDYWANEGWFVAVRFREVLRPLWPTQHASAIGPLLPSQHSPIRANGHGNQSCYLAGISDTLGHLLLALLREDLYEIPEPEPFMVEGVEPSQDVLEDVQLLQADDSLTETMRLQLSRARVGQGLFRTRVILSDEACRVTGVTDQRVLRASHIKPWRESTNAERLSAHNGLLLSPHVDVLFDSKLITFEDDGRMHVHSSLPADVLERWHIDASRKVERFRPEQAVFLAHHRQRFAEKAR